MSGSPCLWMVRYLVLNMVPFLVTIQSRSIDASGIHERINTRFGRPEVRVTDLANYFLRCAKGDELCAFVQITHAVGGLLRSSLEGPAGLSLNISNLGFGEATKI